MLQSLNFLHRAPAEKTKTQRSERRTKSIITKETSFKEFSHEINLNKLKEEKFNITQQKIKSEFANTQVLSDKIRQNLTEKDINHQFIKLFDEIHSINELKRMQLQNQFVVEAENVTVQQIKFHNIMGLMTERNIRCATSQRLRTGKITGEMIPLIRAKSHNKKLRNTEHHTSQDYYIEKNQLRADKLEKSYNMITSLIENNMQISLQLREQIKCLKSIINEGHFNQNQIRTSISQILKKEGQFKHVMDDIKKKLVSQKLTQEQFMQIYEEGKFKVQSILENKSILIQQFENDVKKPFDDYTMNRIQRDHIQPIYEDQNFQINDKNAQELILRHKIGSQKEVGLQMFEFLKIRKSFQNPVLDNDWREQYNFDSKIFKRGGMNFFRLAIIKILSKQSDQIIEEISSQFQQKEQKVDFTEHPVIQFYYIYPKGPKHLANLLIKRFQHFNSQLLFKNKISDNLNQLINEKQKELRNLEQRQAEQNFIDQQSMLFHVDLGNLHYSQLQMPKQDQNDLNLLTAIRKLEEHNDKNDTFLVRIFFHLFENLSKFLQTIEMINNKVKSLISGRIQTVNIGHHQSFIEMVDEKLILQVGTYKKSNKFDEKKLSVKINIFLDKMLDTYLFDENEQIAIKNNIIEISNSGTFQGLFCIPMNYKEYFIRIKKEMECQTTIFQFIKDQAYGSFQKIVQQFILSFQEIIRSQLILFRKQNISKTDQQDFLHNNYNFKSFRTMQQNIAQKIFLNSRARQNLGEDADMKPKNSVNINQRDRSKRKMKDNDEEFEELYLNKTYVTIRDNKKFSDLHDNPEIVEQIKKSSIRQNIDNLSDDQLRQQIIFKQGSTNQQILKTLNKQQTILNQMTRRRSQSDSYRQQLKATLTDFNRQMDKQDARLIQNRNDFNIR